MIALALSILFTISLFLFFKEFDNRNIDTKEAITFNYLTAGLLSIAFGNAGYSLENTVFTDWFLPTVFLGVFFIVMFNIMALTTQKLGVTIGSLASKMSLIIPVIFALVFQGDSWTIIKSVGIIIALLSVYLTVKKGRAKKGPIYLAIVLFIGAGLLDTLLSHIQFTYLHTQAAKDYFTSTVFLVAFGVGILLLLIKKHSFRKRNIIFGILLGIPNYLSILFVLKSLNQMDASIVFPVLNIGVVVFSALIGWGYYKERLSKLNWLGVVLAISSICILIYANAS